LKNKSKFVSLKRFLPILFFTLLIATHSEAQVAKTTPPDNGQKTVLLYPNPATTYITFDLQKSYEKGLSIQIFSFLGRKMYESQNLAEKTTIDLGEYNRGVYLYHLRDQNGKIIQSGKFQVSK